MRSFDLVARYGGEEFLIVMPETSFTVAMTVAERLRATIADGPVLASSTGARVPVTISIGVAVAEGPGDTPAAILRRADEALYSAKNNGRNRVAANGHKPVEITDQLLRAVG